MPFCTLGVLGFVTMILLNECISWFRDCAWFFSLSSVVVAVDGRISNSLLDQISADDEDDSQSRVCDDGSHEPRPQAKQGKLGDEGKQENDWEVDECHARATSGTCTASSDFTPHGLYKVSQLACSHDRKYMPSLHAGFAESWVPSRTSS